ncbi:Flagellar biosynthesis protein FliS [Labilithrix luteola]|uniref:Flagellar biosynthesis protein FliS n=1 Tax=Labilithrix luteola TaxID=1391654 RepID=A0A0K1PNR0_9BACT|nr:flagellar export chaperone FliS [Labilithrix luteola]AKU94729.1 Flagellar biosynthesis protein FliS [Labilithrix luteola]
MSVAAKYQKVQVATCSPAQLVVMLYDGIIRFATEAVNAMERKDRARAGDRIGRAHAILEELLATLDPSQSPELCENLSGLYAFCMHRLLTANLEQNREAIAEVIALVRPLREAFAEIAAKAA